MDFEKSLKDFGAYALAFFGFLFLAKLVFGFGFVVNFGF